MISEFQQLIQKVGQTVTLIHATRNENAELRRQIASLTATNDELTARIGQAHQRVSDVLSKLPTTEQELG